MKRALTAVAIATALLVSSAVVDRVEGEFGNHVFEGMAEQVILADDLFVFWRDVPDDVADVRPSGHSLFEDRVEARWALGFIV